MIKIEKLNKKFGKQEIIKMLVLILMMEIL